MYVLLFSFLSPNLTTNLDTINTLFFEGSNSGLCGHMKDGDPYTFKKFDNNLICTHIFVLILYLSLQGLDH